MASLENRTGFYNIVFRFGGHKFTRSLKTRSKREAESRKQRLEENMRLVESGRIEIPSDADISAFLLSDGKIARKPRVTKVITIERLFEEFFSNLPGDNLEESTVYGMKIHRGHILRLLGDAFPVQRLAPPDLQEYVNTRSKEPGRRGNRVGANTINKEIVTFRCVWNWGVDMGKLHGEFPRKGLRLPKTSEKPPFQTWQEIERQIRRGGLTKAQQEELWDCLYLTLEEIEQLLEYVAEEANQPWLHPMFMMAAHTGARRSELLRSQVSDFDGDEVIIHERKRIRGKQSVRRVPISSQLRRVIDEWFSEHPGGAHTFCQTAIARSKKIRSSPEPVTPDESHDHFRRTLRGGKWARIRGWHCLRHSFISNLACKGVDQRLIDAFVGHTTDAMRRRYTHLLPDTRQAAMKLVFGGVS